VSDTAIPVEPLVDGVPDAPNGEVPTIIDPLAEALQFLRMDGMFYCPSELSAPWGIEMPHLPDSIWFHVVTSLSLIHSDAADD
jgi:hypothetical protein